MVGLQHLRLGCTQSPNSRLTLLQAGGSKVKHKISLPLLLVNALHPETCLNMPLSLTQCMALPLGLTKPIEKFEKRDAEGRREIACHLSNMR